jgi:hypothetical protein
MIAVMLGLTVTMNNALYETTQQVNTKATVVAVSDVVYQDLSRATGGGFDAANGGTIGVTRMSFWVYADSTMTDSIKVTYDVGEVASATGLHKLYRYENNGPGLLIASNLTGDPSGKFEPFAFFTSKGQRTTVPDSVDAVRVKLYATIHYDDVESVQHGFKTALIDFKVFPPNL